MQLASYLERGPLIWMMPLHLYVNQKSDYDMMKEGANLKNPTHKSWVWKLSNTMPDLSDLLPSHSGQVRNFNVLAMGQVYKEGYYNSEFHNFHLL